MMSSKRTSQLAMLSILLTFTHSVGYASATVAPFEVSSMYSEASLVASESPKSKKEIRIQKIKERRLAKKKLKESSEEQKNTEDVASQPKKLDKITSLFSNKFGKEQRARCQERKKQHLSFKEQYRSKTQELKEEQRSLAQQLKQSIDLCCEELVHRGAGNLLTRGGKYSQRYNKFRNCEQTAQENQSAGSLPNLSARQRAKLRKRAGTIVRAAPRSESPKSLLKTIIVNRDSAVAPENNEEIQVVHNIKDGPVLPIFVRPDVKVVAQEERNKLIQDLAREQRIAKRRSAREALEARAKENKIPRDGKVTSTLRYDVEKAAAVKVRRNSSVNSQVRAQKASNGRRNSRSEHSQKDSTQHSKPNASDKQDQLAGNVPTDDYYGVTSAAGNTNINSYLTAKQYSCDSSETDWPCSSCVAKRRTHTSISVCTMVVTVIAMIIGAIIIANASDSTTTNGGGTTPPPNPSPAS
ncbi:hypothetical protein [Chlamydia psittaci]|uniref:hypothetical protein n=1 Tax=Chlamydia psittaci TaxID=83554 RepID=UPI00027E4AD2|nr:hypothetical protein [Chlamydia psittaci]AFS27900.1 hypothetical protein B712_0380 [Chlamydia psittaci NJ1]KPZ38097.1 hypothetical protein GWE_00325 [Chlamydia psittaci NJ1]MDS0919930.1 hypothetical protein [Chlamydia psittaci]MDS0990163.1 hypothetical protein [Chlamydia psittaci]MDS0996136.1 hypothetical protein [Chlamydia psittaci]